MKVIVPYLRRGSGGKQVRFSILARDPIQAGRGTQYCVSRHEQAVHIITNFFYSGRFFSNSCSAFVTAGRGIFVLDVTRSARHGGIATPVLVASALRNSPSSRLR